MAGNDKKELRRVYNTKNFIEKLILRDPPTTKDGPLTMVRDGPCHGSGNSRELFTKVDNKKIIYIYICCTNYGNLV